MKKVFHLYPHKLSLLQHLYAWDFEQKRNYSQWFNKRPITVGVRIAIPRRRIVGPVFLYHTIIAVRYKQQILESLINKLDHGELQYGYFSKRRCNFS